MLTMQKLQIFLVSLFFLSFLSSCNTIKQKTDALVEKENQKLSKFIGKSLSELQSDLGEPDDNFKDEKGNFVFVYYSSKFGISCERRFEIDSKSIVIGFLSKGCF
tara:strand:- start:249 stop:563 length:315 start_codon:yes stop_codon:yes gene_type:complete